jgi:hypothetical protein
VFIMGTGRKIGAALGAVFLVEALAVAGFWTVYVKFSLPDAAIEPIDVITLPGEKVAVSCFVDVDPPGWGDHWRRGLAVVFTEGSTVLGQSSTDALGRASLEHQAGTKDLVHLQLKIGLSLALDRPVAYRPPPPAVYVECMAEGVKLHLCDVVATLKGTSWHDVELANPSEWPADQGVKPTLDRLVRGSASRVVYLAPGARPATTAVRAFIKANSFPEGPILFPDLDPDRDLLGQIKRTWPHLAFAITRQQNLIEALRSRGIPVIVVNAPAGTVEPAANVTFAQDWYEIR